MPVLRLGGGPTELLKEKEYHLRPYFVVPLKENSTLKDLKVGSLYNFKAVLRVKELSDIDITFEVIDLALEEKDKKSKKSLEGSYKE